MVKKMVQSYILLSVVAIVAAILIVVAIESSNPNHAGLLVEQVQRRPTAPFDLRNLSIPAGEIRGGGPPKDGIPAITNPRVLHAADARYLNAADRVVGVSLGDESRAYPISILTQHEIVNDKLGDISIAVTYCPLCDSVVVFDRDTDIGVKEFGVSGLLYNSNVLMYDRSEKESLWSQMKLEGVSGPAKGIKLRVLPMELTTWGAWQSQHPRTDIMSREVGLQRDYSRNPYTSYFSQTDLMFPANPQSAALPLKERIVAVWNEGDSVVVPASYFKGKSGIASLTLNGKQLEVQYDATTDSLRVITSDHSVKWVNAFWFAWYAFHPSTKIFGN